MIRVQLQTPICIVCSHWLQQLGTGHKALVSDSGLAYASLDLLETSVGDYVFLDLNPSGTSTGQSR